MLFSIIHAAQICTGGFSTTGMPLPRGSFVWIGNPAGGTLELELSPNGTGNTAVAPIPTGESVVQGKHLPQRLAASLLGLACMAGFAAVPAQAQTVWYVDEDALPGGDGTSWATAFSDLQAALDAALSGNEIWVAAGTYRPSHPEDPEEPRSVTFQLLSGVAIYGGLAGDEDPQTFDLADRDLVANETILSGDLAQNDIDEFDPWDATLEENCFHVVTGSGTDNSALIDGFTITAGNARGLEANDNHRQRGGGMYNYWGEPVLINVTFYKNMSACGGGLSSMRGYTGTTLLNCTFRGNWARSFGGGACVGECDVTMMDCTFSDNLSDSLGGGLCIKGGEADPVLMNCSFLGNQADEGGAVSVRGGSHPTLSNCLFSGNFAVYGGAMRLITDANPTYTNCTFYANSSPYGNGICTNDSVATLISCIMWNGGTEVWDLGASTTNMVFSNISGGWPGLGYIEADPLFADADGPDDIPGTEDDDLHLLPASPCINAGSNYADTLPTEDFEGNPRVQNCRVDMGAYESAYAPSPFPDCNTTGIDDDCELYYGTSLDCNYNHIPDDCEPDEDCNGNDVQDICDVAGQTSEDCQPNGIPDECEDDADGDQVPDDCDICPGFDDRTDVDGDGVPDGCDGCPNDPDKTEPGVCGCGTADIDSDGDLTLDCNDDCPYEPALTEPSEPGSEATCHDGIDNDCDGLTDVSDLDCPCPCGEIDRSGGQVNLSDFGLFALCYGLGAPGGGCTADLFACSDLDGSGQVDLGDFGLFAVWYGQTSSQYPPDCQS